MILDPGEVEELVDCELLLDICENVGQLRMVYFGVIRGKVPKILLSQLDLTSTHTSLFQSLVFSSHVAFVEPDQQLADDRTGD